MTCALGDKEYFQMNAHMCTVATEREAAADVTALWCQGRKEGVSDSFTLVAADGPMQQAHRVIPSIQQSHTEQQKITEQDR